jgi:4-coumarate--CoA ligase
MSLVSFAFGEFSAHSRLTALIDGVTGRKITFSELISLSKKFSSYLKRIGFKQGDCLGILSPNSLEYPIIVWGVLYAGGVVTTMNPLYTDREACLISDPREFCLFHFLLPSLISRLIPQDLL